MEEVKKILNGEVEERASKVQVADVKKRKVGRPKKGPTEEEIKAANLEHWGDVGGMLIGTVSSVIESKFPGCGPSPDEIAAAKKSIGYLLDHYFPEGSELSVHWSNVVMLLGVPTALKIYAKVQEEAGSKKADEAATK